MTNPTSPRVAHVPSHTTGAGCVYDCPACRPPSVAPTEPDWKAMYAERNGLLTAAWRDLADERKKVADLRIHVEQLRESLRSLTPLEKP